VWEETGYALAEARFAGVLTWSGFEIEDGGLYLFRAEAPEGSLRPCAEGDLDWKPVGWMLSAPQVVRNLHLIGAEVLTGAVPCWHHCDYLAGSLVGYQRLALPAEWQAGS
jgi:hypothetical protein